MAIEFVISGKLKFYPSFSDVHVHNTFLDAGTIYKRLLNHRPVIQNEVHYFVKEFEVPPSNHYVYTVFIPITAPPQLQNQASTLILFSF